MKNPNYTCTIKHKALYKQKTENSTLKKNKTSRFILRWKSPETFFVIVCKSEYVCMLLFALYDISFENEWIGWECWSRLNNSFIFLYVHISSELWPGWWWWNLRTICFLAKCIHFTDINGEYGERARERGKKTINEFWIVRYSHKMQYAKRYFCFHLCCCCRCRRFRHIHLYCISNWDEWLFFRH